MTGKGAGRMTLREQIEAMLDGPVPLRPLSEYRDVYTQAYKFALADVLACLASPDEAPCQQHKWISRRIGGNPADVSSYERVTYCEDCGIEQTEELALRGTLQQLETTMRENAARLRLLSDDNQSSSSLASACAGSATASEGYADQLAALLATHEASK